MRVEYTPPNAATAIPLPLGNVFAPAPVHGNRN